MIGWVIVGGMSLGTVLTLFVVPTFYLLFARDHHKIREPGPVVMAAPIPQSGD
jgi:multidrug efflux pump